MFSLPLFKQSIRSNWVLWSSITGVMSVLCAQFAGLEMRQSPTCIQSCSAFPSRASKLALREGF